MWKRKIELCMTLLFLIGVIIVSRKLSQAVTSSTVAQEQKNSPEERIIMVDAGHGGKDPGKVGINDVLEKDLNLSIAKKLEECLQKENITVMMTRKDDKSEDTKLGDMKKRVELINEVTPALVVSIHQNSYSDQSIQGAQVFYFTHSKASEEAAVTMQEALRQIDSENQRSVKANDTFYMLKKTKVPTIIVECGFLSNPDEAEKLTTEEYQQQLADTICAGIIKWLDK